MTQRLSILLEVPLPVDRIDSYKIEGPFLEIAEKFRTECMALSTKLKLKDKIEFATRVVKTKDTTKPRKPREPAAPAAAAQKQAAAAPAPEAAPVTPPAAGKTPPWAKSPLAAQLDAANAEDGEQAAE